MDKLFFERFELFVYTTIRGLNAPSPTLDIVLSFLVLVAYEKMADFLFYLNKYIEYQ